MIEVIFDGNLGNNLFQYCFGRILATRLGYRLCATAIPGFRRTNDFIDGLAYPDAPEIVLRGQRPKLDFLQESSPRYRVLLTGYFQRYEYYKPYRNDICTWLAMDDERSDVDIGCDDVVVGMRRGRDYIPRHGLPMSYYDAALSIIKHKRVFVCTDSPRDPFVRSFQKRHSAVLRPPGALDNLAFITKFNKIVISNSTFLWWGAFLSNAREIVFPMPANGFWSDAEPLSKNIALEIDDPRFKYVPCDPYVSEFATERLLNLRDQCLQEAKRRAHSVYPLSRFHRKLPERRYVFAEELENSD